MARIPMVTRTVKSTIATVMLCDTVSESVVTKEVTVPRTYDDPKALNKAVRKALEGSPLTFVKVISTSEQEALYGMTEQKFIEQAEVLPPRGTQTEN